MSEILHNEGNFEYFDRGFAMKPLLLVASSALLFFFVACEDNSGSKNDADNVAGTSGGPCYPNNTCNDDLECIDGVCVSLTADNNDLDQVPNDTNGDSSQSDDAVPDTQVTDEAITDSAQNDDSADDSVADSTDDSTDEQTADSDEVVVPGCGNGVIDSGEACDGDSVNCTAIDSGKYASGVAWCNNGCTGYDESTCVLLEDYWVDPDTGLWWTRGQIDETGADVGTFKPLSCATFIMGGYDDWRVPTINELRTLISGCTRTEPYGACAVEDTCTESDCYSAVCDGCESGAGPWNGYYLKNAPWLMNPKVLEEEKFYIVWTSATVGSANYNWGINFLDGRVMNKYTYFDYGGHSKCVRGGN